MLYGRAAEQGQLSSLLQQAAHGASSALVIHGEAGIGKTALLDHLADGAGPARVLRTTGIESETELPFAALHQLLRPALGRLGVLPEPQAAALRAAFGLATPSGQDRFLTGLAVLTLLSEYAGEDPVLCLVDDAQWVDQASLDALMFAARRLDSEGVVMVFALREPRPFGLPELRLDALDREAATELLRTCGAGADLPPHVREQVAAQSRGNPLALIELPRSLSEEQRDGLLGPLPAAPADPTPSSRVQAAFGTRIDRLPESARAALVVAAADDTGDLATVLRAAGVTPAALEPAETVGLIRLEGSGLTFRHPLVRAAAYRSAPLSRRIDAHRALADALDGPEHADRRAWHRAAATTGPDEAVARDLDRAAERAVGRQGTASASAALERAAQLSPDPVDRRRRLIAAAQAAADAGQFQRVTALLRRGDTDLAADGATAGRQTAGPPAAGPQTRVAADTAAGAQAAGRQTAAAEAAVELARVRAASELNSGSAVRAVEVLLGTGSTGTAILVEAFHAAHSAGHAGLLGRLRDRVAAARPDPYDTLADLAALYGGDPLDGSRLAATARDDTALFSERFQAAHAVHLLADHENARDLATLLVAHTRAHGLLGWQATSLHLLAETHLVLGELEPAARTAAEGLRIAQYAGLDHRACYLRATLATCAALEGDGPNGTRYAEAALAHATAHDLGTAAAHAHRALALAHLGAGDPARALDHLDRADHDPAAPPSLAAAYLPDLVEAAARTGTVRPAALARVEQWAALTGRPAALALAARCRALTGGDDTAEEHFTAALTYGEQAGGAFERARTQLLHGEWLRRRRRRSDARRRLRAALELFEQLGARPWAERARAELRGTGEVIDATSATGTVLGRLTPQEREVVRLAAAGHSNREIATQLFLSPRTVGHHLYRAFPKLGVTARDQLRTAIEG
ncbi:AAA family ATPase [Streptomyces sp. WAC06614]|uniref:AAA family ATPase n=1 Tax=Streptomyces sp. WAC06614 TaxID=2487416 RepID=UPI000F78D440|nr:LuxR family transcriptional regulator [Streptomyces sp. WAC06614]RSS81013.1 LuxR family transcriptional regulator [Streptomyces sp. WAC06614]